MSAAGDRTHMPDGTVRLHVFLARAGQGSRRAMEKAIVAGRVAVGGAVVHQMGVRVPARADDVTLDGRPVRLADEPRIVIALHKPRGVLTTVSDPHGRRTVMDLLPAELRALRLYPVGRLDFVSEGLVLLTNHGELAHRLMHPRFGQEREYEVHFTGRMPSGLASQLAAGIDIGERRPARAEARQVTASHRGGRATLILREGRKREIRRMFEALGLKVARLRRTRIGPVSLGDLESGASRRLTARELARLGA